MSFDADYANKKTREYLDSIMVEQRLLDAVVSNQDITIWGKKYAIPIMTPAFSHLKTFVKEQKNGMVLYSEAAKNVNTLNWVGMSENDEFKEIMEANPNTVRIIKPYADKNKVFKQIEFADKSGAVAVGVDIDHIFGVNGKCDVAMGEEMTCQSTEQIKEYVKTTKLPFVIKGVLSVSDALKCAEAGVQGIVVSHHHGRLPFAIPPLLVLPQIKKALQAYPQIKIFVDCGIDTGYDAFKALALGADAVSAGRILMPELAKEGRAGVENCLIHMNEQLGFMMNFCGCKSLKDINPSLLYTDSSFKKLDFK